MSEGNRWADLKVWQLLDPVAGNVTSFLKQDWCPFAGRQWKLIASVRAPVAALEVVAPLGNQFCLALQVPEEYSPESAPSALPKFSEPFKLLNKNSLCLKKHQMASASNMEIWLIQVLFLLSNKYKWLKWDVSGLTSRKTEEEFAEALTGIFQEKSLIHGKHLFV